MDDESGVEVAGEYLRNDAIEGNGDRLEGRIEDFEGEIGGSKGAGNGNFETTQIGRRNGAAGDDHGSVALSHAAAAAHERVVLLEIGVGVKADGGDVVKGFVLGALVEGLDIAESVGKAIAGDADLIGGQAIEHKGVVGVWAMCDGDIERSGGTGESGLLSTHSGTVLSGRAPILF